MLKLEDLKEGNARRDASSLAMFTEVLDRMREAEQDIGRYGRPGAEYNGPKHDAAQERRNRHRQALIDAYRMTLEGASNIQIKYFELAALTPPKPWVIPTVKRLEAGSAEPLDFSPEKEG